MHKQDIIDAYVKGQLSAAEKVDFEAALTTDPALAAAVEQARLDLELAELLLEDEARGWMKEWSAGPPPGPNIASSPHSSPPPVKIPWARWLGLAVLILSAGALVRYLLTTQIPAVLKQNPPASGQPQAKSSPDTTTLPTAGRPSGR
ncbi:MAG: hypothetical protein ABIQ93_11055, partial [Saprospiraceae bacterium]